MVSKERLAAAKPRTAVHPLRIEDDRAAREALAEAQASGDEERITTAKATLDACYEPLHLTAMPLPEWDDLVTRHPPSDEWRTRGRFVNPETFIPPALVRCATNSDVDEADWQDYISKGAIAPGEALAVLDALLMVHDRSPDVSLGKDLTTIRN